MLKYVKKYLKYIKNTKKYMYLRLKHVLYCVLDVHVLQSVVLSQFEVQVLKKKLRFALHGHAT